MNLTVLLRKPANTSVCQKNYREATSCCYEDPPKNSMPSTGMKRMFGEWSVSFDTLVVLKLYNITAGIAETGIAAEFDRQLSPGRQEFLRNFAMAQMIAYEAAELGTSVGWFYWNFKMEGTHSWRVFHVLTSLESIAYLQALNLFSNARFRLQRVGLFARNRRRLAAQNSTSKRIIRRSFSDYVP
jgi:hypothetical protein